MKLLPAILLGKSLCGWTKFPRYYW